MKTSQSLRILPVCLFLLASIGQAMGYIVENLAWPARSKVVMHLGLGPTLVPLQDGTSSWNASAADALAIWNGYLDFISISSVSSSTVPEVSGDGVNSVFFSNTIFGDSFGEDTLAVTVFLGAESQAEVMAEADVVVNSAYRYNSYRGAEQSGVYDFHRIVLHEFGHVLGLGHDTTYPSGTKIMEPVISDLDHLGADDINGVRSLYGADFLYPPGAITLRIGYPFITDLYVNNNPTSFTATGLPPGLAVSDTGRITGTPTTGGTYNSVITAHGPIVDVSEGYHFTILGLEEVPGLLSILPSPVWSIVADPIRPRIYFSGSDGINMIDTETLEVTNLPSAHLPNARLSISPDASTLLYTQPWGLPSQEFKIDLDSLTAPPAIRIPPNRSGVLEGLNNRAYAAGASGVYQFNATTGGLQHSFAPPKSTSTATPTIAISPDRRTLYVARESTDGDLSAFDISTHDPILLKQFSGSFSSLAPSCDGQFLYYVKGNTGSYSLVQVPLPTLSPAKPLFTSSRYLGPTTVGPDGLIYQSIYSVDNGILTRSGSMAVYDPITLQEVYAIEVDNLQADTYPYLPFEIAFDNSGKHFFVTVAGSYGEELWIFSSNLATLPPPPARPTRNLLNISTRARVETEENAMIGGFIVQGTHPKKILIRGLGPSLPMTGAMSNPVLSLYDSTGKLMGSNDNWISNRMNIIATQLAPSSERESTILVTLHPGSYTAVVRDFNNQPGLALVEVYDLDPKDSLLANISTRGRVETGDNVMIGGFIVGGVDPTKVIVRAIGPSLTTKGIREPLADPILELHDGNGALISSNDNWRSTQPAEIAATGIPPTDNRESAILVTLQPGSYTAIVRGHNNSKGVALVEVYNLDATSAGSN